ncbi:GNAT family N-acetyltransferase [Catelliglobosispora koreensis]|uniref:GNAT family N-acetyltransferase n=1 Tax=Catelliglobosispora koreensis TaxID=129052 RepID=UPI00035CE435|nr:GNAT family N-acetyltransferase [Catelliglobosispora koreensis]
MTGRAADVLLSDGTTVHLRQIEPSDADALVAMHSRFSERTRYLRFFSPYPRIPARDLERFVNVDHSSREALVILSGPNMVGVGRYERLGPDAPDAEVAFAVEDAYQGRGVGSVLLEHLAAAARDAGIERFVAEVLPANDAMLRVFADAGYEVTRRYADGVVHLVFPVAQTQRSLAVQWDREHRTEARSVARLIRPQSVAVYGASASGRGVGAAILSHLTSGGFPGAIYVVHPRGPLTSLRDAVAAPLSSAPVEAELPHKTAPIGAEQRGEQAQVDLAIVAVPPARLGAVVADAGAAGVHGLLVITELDPAQRRELVAQARVLGMRVIGPGSLGIADHVAKLNATLVPRLPAAGRVALFCQSGTLGLQLLAEADRRQLGLSSFASAGRRADVSGNDLLQFWADDPETDLIVMYLETFGNPRKFSRIAREVGRRKPILVLASETGVGSTLDRSALDALRAQSGVIEAGTVSELFDTAGVLATQPLPAGDRIGIVSNAFALTALAGARVRGAGLRVGRAGAVGPAASASELAAAARTTLDSEDADAVLVILAPPLPTGPLVATEAAILEPYRQVLRDVAEGADKPFVVISLLDSTIEEAVRALAHAAKRAAWLREPPGTFPEPVNASVSTLEEALDAYGIPVLPSVLASGAKAVTAAAKRLGYPVAIKAVEHQHRIDIGAVRLNLGDEKVLRKAYSDLEAIFGPEVVVQPMAAPGVACRLEIRDDPAFGPVVGFGLGGPVAELVGDQAWRAAPLSDLDAAGLVRAPKAAALLAGADLASLAQLLTKAGQLADEVPRLRSLTLNPVLVHEKGWTVLHAEGEMDDPAERPDSGPRKL